MKTIKIGTKSHPFHGSIYVAQLYAEKGTKLTEKGLSELDTEYVDLIVSTIKCAIDSGYYASGGFKRYFRWFLSPSKKEIELCVSINQMQEAISSIFGDKETTSQKGSGDDEKKQ